MFGHPQHIRPKPATRLMKQLEKFRRHPRMRSNVLSQAPKPIVYPTVKPPALKQSITRADIIVQSLPPTITRVAIPPPPIKRADVMSSTVLQPPPKYDTPPQTLLPPKYDTTPPPPDNTTGLAPAMFFQEMQLYIPKTQKVLYTQIKLPNPKPFVPAYAGTDVHAYTQYIRRQMQQWLPGLTEQYGVTVDASEFEQILLEMENRYGYKPTFHNMRQAFRDGWIVDPQVSELNSATLLKALWCNLQKNDEPSAHAHFAETLDQIGTTCIQGISHRLFHDYLAFCT
jgi:hypothetical protein